VTLDVSFYESKPYYLRGAYGFLFKGRVTVKRMKIMEKVGKNFSNWRNMGDVLKAT
jgi:hypothetical protein